jgi:chromosome segregation ATPase
MPIIYNSNFANSAGAAMREFAPVNKSVRDTMFKLEELRMREEAMDQREAQFRTRLEQQAKQFEESQRMRLDLQDRADAFSRKRLEQQSEQFERSQGLREQQQAQRDRLAEIGIARQAELDAYQKEQDQLSRDFAGEQLELKRLEAQRAHEARLKNIELSERELEARTGAGRGQVLANSCRVRTSDCCPAGSCAKRRELW